MSNGQPLQSKCKTGKKKRALAWEWKMRCRITHEHCQRKHPKHEEDGDVLESHDAAGRHCTVPLGLEVCRDSEVVEDCQWEEEQQDVKLQVLVSCWQQTDWIPSPRYVLSWRFHVGCKEAHKMPQPQRQKNNSLQDVTSLAHHYEFDCAPSISSKDLLSGNLETYSNLSDPRITKPQAPTNPVTRFSGQPQVLLVKSVKWLLRRRI